TASTPVMGALRDYIPQMVKAVAYYRQRNRYDESVTLRIAMPQWVQALLVCDMVKGSGYDADYIRDARAIIASALANVNAIPGYYVDSGTGKGQYFAPGSVSGAKHGAGALVAFPSTVVTYIWPEGSFLFLDGGSLDFGMFRDASLNAQNNFRMMAETWEGLAAPGPEMLEITSTLVANGTFAGAAYGSNTVSSPVAIPSSF
ncbi:MAG TPA: major capsid protein, partial [Acidimicrobiales bacterium]